MSEARRRIWAATHRGLVRPSNQDRALTPLRRSVSDNEAWTEQALGEAVWAAVADGMGGHEAGNIASDVAIASAARLLPTARTEHDMADLALAANRQIFKEMFSGEGRIRMGTTLIAALLREGAALLVNVGDSRAYRMAGGLLQLVTKDDTLPSRNGGRRQHMLTQSLGGLAFQATITPHVSRIAVNPGDRLLLCTDGLTDMVSEEAISQILLEVTDNPASALVNAALAGGGRDNVTVVVIG